MTKMTRLRIHVCPIGYEIDRIVQSAIELCAERVWLLVEKNTSKENATKFIGMVESQLKESSIQVKRKGISRDDLFDNLKGLKEIFDKEKENEILVNVSAGSKIQAIAGMMACMIFKEYSPIPYYVKPEKYGDAPESPQSFGVKEIVPLPKYSIQKPGYNLIKTLDIMTRENKINKKTLAKIAIKEKLINSKNDKVDQSDYAKLDHQIIKPLEEEWKFIKVEKIGTNHQISLTDEGRDACKFLI